MLKQDEKILIGECTLELSSEILLTREKSGNVTRVVRKVVRHFLEAAVLKEKSKESLIIEELFKSKDIKIQNIKDEIEKFIHLSAGKINLSELYDKLSDVPFYLTKQVISLLLLDVLLKQGDRVSVFEKGMFQLDITSLMYDRLMVNPKNFEIQKNIFTDEKKNYLEILAGVLKEKTDNLLDITKTIVYKIQNLDKYTKQTERLSRPALKLRNTILNAKEPYRLIFNDIPLSFGFKNFEDCDNKFFKLFDNSLRELDENYSGLLSEIERFFFNAFGLKPDEKSKKPLIKKINAIEEFISVDDIKIAANNFKVLSLPHNRWLERIATVINKKNVPKNWSDNDLAEFKQKIILISDEIKRIENLSQGVKGIKVSTTDANNEFDSLLERINSLPKMKILKLMNVLKKKIA